MPTRIRERRRAVTALLASTLIWQTPMLRIDAAARLREPAPSPQQQPPPQQAPPPPVVTGAGGAGGGPGGGGGAGGGSGGGPGGPGGPGGGYDGYSDIDWDGPDEAPVTSLAFEPFAAEGLLEAFRTATRGIASSVPPKQMTYDDAIKDLAIEMERRSSAATMTALKAMGREPNGVDRLGTLAGLSAIGGTLDQSLAATLTQHWTAPKNQRVMFNLASQLIQRRMPNHALAVIDELRKNGGTPGMLFGYKPSAAVDYVEGYAKLLIGRLQESASLLSRSFAADSQLTDAAYALAVAQEAMGADPRKALLHGVLRPYGGPLMYCGEHYDLDPYETDEDDTLAPPTDKLFDLSQGTDGVLPPLVHPASGARLVWMIEEFNAKQRALSDEVIRHRKQADQIHETLVSNRLNTPGPDATDLTDEAIVSMIDEANVCLKPLQIMRLARNKALDDMGAAVEQQTQSMRGDYAALMAAIDEPAKAIRRNMITKAIAARRPAIQEYDRAVRVMFRSWNKYATGLAGHITDPEWRKYADEIIAANAAAQWYALNAGVITSYAADLGAGSELYAPDAGQATTTQVPAQPLWRCTAQQQKTSIEAKVISVKASEWGARAPIPDVSLTVKANCDKLALEADAKISASLGNMASVGIGGFVETSVNRAGDVTLFGGPKISGEVGAGSGAVSSSLKDGVYITFDSDGIKEIGTRIASSGTGASGGGRLSQKLGEESFVIWTGPPRPPKFDRATGLTIWRNVR